MRNPRPTEIVCADAIGLSAVVATLNRPESIRRTFESLANQSVQPSEIVVVDGSPDSRTMLLCEKGIRGLRSELRWIGAKVRGAASQRSEGVSLARRQLIWFFDDDIVFEPECLARLWEALNSDPNIGGVNATIVNQSYAPPGTISRLMFTLMSGKNEKTFAGKVIGPAVNLLPDDRDDLPGIVPVDWLNLGCTIYRREALPSPVFDDVFTGYSVMEDLTLSLRVAQRGWKLANARTARIFHDSQPGDYKSNQRLLSCMELRNRHFIMTRVLGRRGVMNHLKLALWELFSLISVSARPSNWRRMPSILAGKMSGVRQIVFGKPLC